MGSGAMPSRWSWPLYRALVTGPSMTPALHHGDVVLVRRSRPGRVPPLGSVVVVALPGRPLAVKRLSRVDPDGRVWVEGDNPFGSTDSRQLGTLPADAVHGRVVGRVWPRPACVRASR
jgi:nickel-type superoxide dismutase maturation protease